MRRVLAFFIICCFPWVRALPQAYLFSAQYSPAVADAFSAAFNPALLPTINNFEVGLHSENTYMLSELKMITICGAFSNNNNGISTMFQYFGNAQYNEKQFVLNYGKSLGGINVGACFNYSLLNVSDGTSQSHFNFGLASIWKLSEKVFAGFSIMNPQFSAKGNKNETLTATKLQMGIGFQASDKLYAGIESEKLHGKPPQIIALLRYLFDDKVFFRAAWETMTNKPFIGAGLSWNDIRIEAGCSYHMVLGPSPVLILSYRHMEETKKNK